MRVVLVDHPLPAEALRCWLQDCGVPADRISADDCPPVDSSNALLLVELFLPDGRCGLQVAHHLHEDYPELTPLVWTRAPDSLYLWAAKQYGLPGFLDKESSPEEAFAWLERAETVGFAWPAELWDRAQVWEREVAVRLRELTPELWQLWMGLLRGMSNRQLALEMGWSLRTIGRRLSDLYGALGVSDRLSAMAFAVRRRLVTVEHNGAVWSAVVLDHFDVSYVAA